MNATYDEILFSDFMRDFYQSDFYNVGWWSSDTLSQREASASLARHVASAIPASCRDLLEVGCGLGASTDELIRALSDEALIYGVGISPQQIEYCRKRVPRARFSVEDGARLSFRDECFDAVVAIESALHIDSRSNFLHEAYRVLRPSGVFAFTDLLVQSEEWPGAWTIPVTNFGWSVSLYEEDLRRCGFDKAAIVDVTAVTWTPHARQLAEHAQNAGEPWNAVAQMLLDAPPPIYVTGYAFKP